MQFDDASTAAYVASERPDEEELPNWISQVMDLYQSFSSDTSKTLESIYSEDVVFSDPLHRISGRAAVADYFQHIGKGLDYCKFEFYDICVREDCAWMKWTMTFAHRKLKRGKPIKIQGATELRRQQKIVSHTDFYDVGAMLYEHVPAMGRIVKMIKRKLINS